MPIIRLGDLTTFIGDASGSWLVINDPTNTSTYKIQRETLLNGVTPYPINITGSTLYSNNPATSLTSLNNSIFFGLNSGYQATNANFSNFFGYFTGYQAVSALDSNFIGPSAGYQATNANRSNFLGRSAGIYAANAFYSNFLGFNSGLEATNAQNSNFFGESTGNHAENASYSNFFGQSAGTYATDAYYSNFIGAGSGYFASSASYCNLFGFKAGFRFLGAGIGSNNIIIGNNITLEDSRKNSINLGGIIFGTGSYFNLDSFPYSGSANGKIGINQPIPVFSLDVSGSGRYTNGLEITGSLTVSNLFTLAISNPLPLSNIASASVMASGSGSDLKPYFWNGSTWTPFF